MIIYDEIFKDYYIKLSGVSHYKVFKRRKCIKLDKYKELDKHVETLADEDYNYYDSRVSTQNNLMSAVIYIYEQLHLYPKGFRKTTLYQLINYLNDFAELC